MFLQTFNVMLIYFWLFFISFFFWKNNFFLFIIISEIIWMIIYFISCFIFIYINVIEYCVFPFFIFIISTFELGIGSLIVIEKNNFITK